MSEKQIIGFGRHAPEQWERLIEISEDGDDRTTRNNSFFTFALYMTRRR